MIMYNYDSRGGQHVCDMEDMFHGTPAFLVGGAPSLKEQNYSLLEQRGVLTFAINNTGVMFRPTCMISCDDPRCFDPRLLLDPSIIKFAWDVHNDSNIRSEGKYSDVKYRSLPNLFMFEVTQKDNFLYLNESQGVPWKHSSLFASIHLLYHLGIRKIYLAGSDFGPNKTGEDYSAGANLQGKEKIWNEILYRYQIQDLIKFKKMFESHNLEIIDTSKNSKLFSAYRTCTIEEGVRDCLSRFPEEFARKDEIPHVSKLCSDSEIDKVCDGKYSVIQESDYLLKDNDTVKNELKELYENSENI